MTMRKWKWAGGGLISGVLICYVAAYALRSKPGTDERPHPEPTHAEQVLAEANWLKLERALAEKDFRSARSLIGKPILFQADLHNFSPEGSPPRLRAFARRFNLAGDGMDVQSLRNPDTFEQTMRFAASLPKFPCRWKFTPLQERRLYHSRVLDLRVYGTLRSFGSEGIEVAPQEFRTFGST